MVARALARLAAQMPRLPPDERAAAIALRTLTGRDDRAGRWLLCDERTGQLAPEITARGGEVVSTFRWTGPWGPAHADLPEGPFDAAFLRLPRARPALKFAVERIAARMLPGAALWLAGCNDEGIKSARAHLQPWFDEIETLDTKHHARLWWASRTDAPARAQLADYLREVRLDLPAGQVVLRAAPGVFAKGGVDEGSRLLLQVLGERGLDPDPTRILDLGCGIGVLSAGVLQRWPQAEVHAVDHDAVAVAALQAGLPSVHAHVSDGLDGVKAATGFDLVISNPPLHGTSNRLSPGLAERLVEQAASHLAPGGHLMLVIQRQRPIGRLLGGRFKTAKPLADDGRFVIWHATGPT